MMNDSTKKKLKQESSSFSYPVAFTNQILPSVNFLTGVNSMIFTPTSNITAGGVYQRKGRRTWRVWFPWKGKKIFVNKYLDGRPLYNKEYAETVLEKIRSEVDQGIFDPASWTKENILLFENAWRIYQKQHKLGKDRMQARERIFKDYLWPYFHGHSLKEIEEHHIMEWWETIPNHFKPSYLKVIRATLKAFLNSHRITRAKVFEFPMVKVPQKTPDWLSRGEQENILESVPSHHQPIIRFLMMYGCRVSEACNLKGSDIDLEKDIIIFRDRKNGKDNPLPLLDEVKSFLKDRKIDYRGPVFCTVNGGPYTRQVLYRIWVDACKKAKVRIIPLKNATRHSLACQLLNNGKSSSVVSRILGNTAAVVERSYGSIGLKAVSEALKEASQDGHQMGTYLYNTQVLESAGKSGLIN